LYRFFDFSVILLSFRLNLLYIKTDESLHFCGYLEITEMLLGKYIFYIENIGDGLFNVKPSAVLVSY